MAGIRSVGFPKMIVEAGEKRVWLPEMMKFFAQKGVKVVLEKGYGGDLFSDEEYAVAAPVELGDRKEAFAQDLVLILRSPTLEEYAWLKPEGILMSMLHYPTRPQRVEVLSKLKRKAISLDSIVNDKKIRLVENMKAVAWNGLEAAFDYLERSAPSRFTEAEPIRVLILGTGMVGKHAVEAATKMGAVTRYNSAIKEGWAGALALSLGRSTTQRPDVMAKLLAETDIIVDATQRPDASAPVLTNEQVGMLPGTAIVVDLSVDPYALAGDEMSVKGIEGTPQGNLDQYVIEPDDELWDKTVPAAIPSDNRRTSVTCYSWPGIHPNESMQHYQEQLEPLLEVLIEKGYGGLSREGSYFERALWRATLEGWKAVQKEKNR